MEKIKKIIFTVTNDLTYDQRMQRIAASLLNAGYDVTLVGFVKKRSVKLQPAAYRQKRLHVVFKKGKLFFIEYNIKLFFYLLFKKFDIYCGIDLDTLLPIYFNAKLKRKPCVYDAHEYYTELPEIIHRPIIRFFWKKVEKFLLPKIKYNYTVGISISNALSGKYHQPYEVIRNVPMLINTNTNANNIATEKIILYQGALNKGRGIENLMMAIKNIDAVLFIAGEGDLSEQLRALGDSLPHANKIRFLGYIRPVELQKYTQQATIGINLVENAGLSYYYSLSNKFFDYIHAGIPQITMNFPEYKTLNNLYNIALLIDNTDVANIEAAINKLIADKELYALFKNNTTNAKMQLNWQIEEQKLIKFYSNIE